MKKILVVGAGSIGRRHMDNFLSQGVPEVSVVDINPDRIQQAKNLYKIHSSYTDFKTALKSEKFDAVAITTPPHVHLPIAKEAVMNGCHLFVEKPVGMNCDGWDEVVKICQEKKLVNYVAFCHRHIPYTTKLKEIVDSGRVGRIVHGNVRWGSYLPDWHPYEDYRSFYMSKKEQGGGALLDESHGIDLVRYILGEVKGAFAIVDNISDLELTSDDAAFLTLKMKSNALVHINFDLQSRIPRINCELIGTKGNIIWDRMEHVVKVYDIERKSWEHYNFNMNHLMSMYPTQALHFIKCVRGEEKPLIDLADGLKTQKVIDACFKSSESGKFIEIG